MGKKFSNITMKVKDISVLIKLTTSYLFLIILVAVSIGLTTYYLSSKNYNSEVIKLNHQLLEQYSSTVHQYVIKTTEETQRKMVLDVNVSTDIDILFENKINLPKIHTLYDSLNKLVNASDNLYQGIHIYSKRNNFVLSSVIGIKYLDSASPYSWKNLTWITEMPDMKETSYWMPTHEVSYSTQSSSNIISYIAAYPSNLSFEKAKGYIRFDINENYLMDILTNIDIGGTGELFLIDNLNNIVAHSNGVDIPSTVYDLGFTSPEFFQNVSSNDAPVMVNGVENMVSYVSIGEYWKLVRSVPINDFYSTSKKIALIITAICLAAVVAAMLIAYIFAKNIYSPLKLLTNKIRKFTSDDKSNEYAMINDALVSYDSQIANLNKKWQDNIINLKQNLLRNIISGTIHTEHDFNKRMKLTGHECCNGNYNIILINISESDITDIISSQKKTLLNKLVIYIENLSDEDNVLIASEMTLDSIAVLIISKTCQTKEMFEEIIAFASNSLMVDVEISLGSWKDSPLGAHSGYLEAQEAYRYKFFMPQKNAFIYENMQFQVETETSSKIKKLYSQYSKSLKSDDEVTARVQIHTLIETITDLCPPLQYGYDCLEGMTAMLREYIDNYYIGESDIELNLHNLQDHFSDIYDFEKWMTQATYHILELKKSQSDRKVDDIILNIKRYISENLANDLSLTRLSEYTTLSNCYLSRIFKESTGINVVDYITEQRMIRAKKLLETTTLNIELVASSCGYITPHYFSMKFKQYFGLTPRSYRIAYGEQNTSENNDII